MKTELEKAWNKAIGDYLLTPPNDPSANEKLRQAIEVDKKARVAGFVLALSPPKL